MTQYFKLNKLIFGISLLASVQFSSKLSAKVDIASNSTILSLKEHLIKNAQREEGKQDSVIASPQIIEGNETKPASVDFKLSKSVVYDASINLLAASPEKEAAPAPLFSVTLMDDLQCLNGTRKSVLSAVDRTQTAAGHNYLASLLSQGCTNAQLLQKRQNVIRYLYLNPKIHDEVKRHLSIIQKNEAALYSWWKTTERTENDIHNKIIKNSAITSQDSNNAKSFVASSLFRGGNLNSMYKIGHLGLATFGAYKLHSLKKSLGHLDEVASHNSWKDLIRAVKHYVNKNKTTVGGVIALEAFMWYFSSRATKEAWDLQQIMLSREKALARIIESTKALISIISDLEDVKIASPELNIMRNEIARDLSKELSPLEEYIKSATFNENAHLGHLSHHANISKIYLLMDRAKNKLSSTLKYIGMIDMYSSVATLLHEVEANPILINPNNPEDGVITFSFARIIKNATTPCIIAKNFFNPVIDRNIVRPSTMSFGEPDKNRCGIITGPNAGGKSVNLKGLLINIMLAQSLTIAAAEHFEITPFSVVVPHLKSVDNIIENASKFIDEAKIFANMLKVVYSLRPLEFAFLVTDELFTGTEIEPAIKLSHQACLTFGDMPNCIYLLATHYKQLASLETETNGLYKNFCVHGGKDPVTKKLVYPYSIFEGVGGTNVAFDVFLEQLEKQGINDPRLVEVIEKARDSQI